MCKTSQIIHAQFINVRDPLLPAWRWGDGVTARVRGELATLHHAVAGPATLVALLWGPSSLVASLSRPWTPHTDVASCQETRPVRLRPPAHDGHSRVVVGLKRSKLRLSFTIETFHRAEITQIRQEKLFHI